MPDFERNSLIGQNDASAAAKIVLHLDFPILRQTQSRRFWRFTYDADRVTAIVNTIPVRLSAFIASATRRSRTHKLEGWSNHLQQPIADRSPLAQSMLTSENGTPAGLAEELHFGLATVAISTQLTADHDNSSTAATVWTVGSIQGGDTAGSIVPLVELDMLCLLIHNELHKARQQTARYLRVWLGGGAAALVLWETDRDAGGQVRRAYHSSGAASGPQFFTLKIDSEPEEARIRQGHKGPE